MKKLSLLLLAAASLLTAADFWLAKPYTEWSDKELQKLMTDSPWAKTVTITPIVLPTAGGDAPPPSRDLSSGKGGGKGGGGGGGQTAAATQTYIIHFMSGVPMKQGAQKIRLGKEAASSAESRALIEREEKEYIVVVSVAASSTGRGGGHGKSSLSSDALKQAMTECTLASKEKGSRTPTSVQMREGVNGGVDAFLFFPRNDPFTINDGDVEVAFKFAGSTIKQKFHLREMVFNGKLEM